MKLASATYEHTRIGFPKVILKWHEEDGKFQAAYITAKGIILRDVNANVFFSYPGTIDCKTLVSREEACQRFDEWVAGSYHHDASVQG